MAEVHLNASKREESGKGPARRSRRDGNVPGVIYGHGMEPLPIEVDRREFLTALNTESGMNVLLDLEIDGSTTLALTKELQRDPVRGTLLHADFIQIDRKQEVEVEVPIHLIGSAPGVGEGGVLQHPMSSLHVRSLATEVPQSIDVDVSSLALGDTLRVSDLAEGKSFTILNDPETVVAAVSQPVSEAELEAMEADAGVVTEDTDVEEAAAAGDSDEGTADASDDGAAVEPE